MQEDEHFSDLKLGDIREHWHWVKHGVEEVIKLNNASYKPEDVYARCIYGEANLFLNEGMFFITTITVDEFNMKKSYSLWVMWASVLHTKIYSAGKRVLYLKRKLVVVGKYNELLIGNLYVE